MLFLSLFPVLTYAITGVLYATAEATGEKLDVHHAIDTFPGRQLKKPACLFGLERQFFYETSVKLDVAGDNPECTTSELQRISRDLMKEFDTVLQLDPRLSLVFNLQAEFCDLVPEEIVVNQNQRELATWYSIDHDYQAWSSRYQFDFVGVGNCRFCVPYRRSLRYRNTNYNKKSFSSSASKTSSNYSKSGIDSETTAKSKSEPTSPPTAPPETPSAPASAPSDKTATAETPANEDYTPIEDKPTLDPSEVRIDSFALYQANVDPPKRLQTVNNFAVIDLINYKDMELTLVAERSESGYYWVEFDSDSEIGVRTEYVPPLTISGDDEGKLHPFPPLKQVGTHTVTAHAKAFKKTSVPFTISFLVIDSSDLDEKPDNDPAIIDVLEEDLSFQLSHAINKKYFRKPNHCLEKHLAYVRVDMNNIQHKEHQCSR